MRLGLLGFSQGSAVVNTLAALQTKGDHRFQGMFRFVVLVAGVVPKDPDAMSLFAAVRPMRMPSLHIFGETDFLRDISEMISTALYSDSTKLRHALGHRFPIVQGESASIISSFMQRQLPSAL
eukprot:GHVS01039960.1.p1 GENE.GHVS01039960.1~~GHVS01039960.1.p1  ORF type:complete len:123 (+),score=7.50 GHVS01039960.1:658-1026(+)